jgi:UDP-glucose:(heptosyl)LPS alpha-1,3-glucosyltransferase
MRIAIIKSNYAPYGGAEKYATRLIDFFVRNNVEVDVLASKHGRWDGLPLNVNRVALKQLPYNNLLRLLTFNSSVNRYLRKAHYDCIFGMDRTEHQTHLWLGGGCHRAWISRRCGENSLLKCLSFKINPFHRAVMEMERRAVYSHALKRIFCNSNLVKDEILHFYPGIAGKFTIVYNSAGWYEFSEAFEEGPVKKNSILKAFNLSPDKFYYLFLGSGYERKGLAKAIMALRFLPDYTELIVVGKDKHENRYKMLSEKSRIADRVHFFGPRMDVVPFLQVSDASILPTLYDPCAGASVEALAMGLYTVTSGANGASEVIQDGAGSVIQDLRDLNSVAEAMKKALVGHLSKKEIRDTVKHLDFEAQLRKIVTLCIEDMEIGAEKKFV